MTNHIKLTTTSLPVPWCELSYHEIMARSGGQLFNDGRASRVFRFSDGAETCFLKRYTYHKIHWSHCWQKSQVRREYENLNQIKQADLGCEIIDILAYGEQRQCRILKDCFILSRAVANGESLALFLSTQPNHPQRRVVLENLCQLAKTIIKRKLAITGLFFRNIVVVPEQSKLFLLDVQYFDNNQRRALNKSYPQF